MKAVMYTQSGVKKKEVALNEKIFGVAQNSGLVHDAVIRQLSNGRVDTAFTLQKGEVRGGGRKPLRQKGSGRARQGSITNPHYAGGGVAFGPRGQRNYEKRMPQKMRRAAIFAALSSRAQEQGVVVLDSYEAKAPKTRDFAAMLSAMSVGKKVLMVLPEKNFVLEKSAANLSGVRVLNVQYLNVVDVLWADTVLFVEPALKKAEEIFLK